MTWQRGKTNPKYTTPEHRRLRRKCVAQMQRDGFLMCQQPICLLGSRVIQDGSPWHLGHDDSGEAYIGPVHAQCNVRDGAKRARAKQLGRVRRWGL